MALVYLYKNKEMFEANHKYFNRCKWIDIFWINEDIVYDNFLHA